VRKTKGFSYDPEIDKDVINHIDSQQNGSQYVWGLVRADMSENSIENIVNRQIKKYLQDHEITAGSKEKDIKLDANEIKNILNL
jgi:hypothetical protein